MKYKVNSNYLNGIRKVYRGGDVVVDENFNVPIEKLVESGHVVTFEGEDEDDSNAVEAAATKLKIVETELPNMEQLVEVNSGKLHAIETKLEEAKSDAGKQFNVFDAAKSDAQTSEDELRAYSSKIVNANQVFLNAKKGDKKEKAKADLDNAKTQHSEVSEIHDPVIKNFQELKDKLNQSKSLIEQLEKDVLVNTKAYDESVQAVESQKILIADAKKLVDDGGEAE